MVDAVDEGSQNGQRGAGSMKAIVQEEYGPPDVLQLKEIDKPAGGDHDVLVRVQAAADHPGDYSS
jgi:NADPH:quinone reductase-like Zn-dependent oxidoreductase